QKVEKLLQELDAIRKEMKEHKSKQTRTDPFVGEPRIVNDRKFKIPFDIDPANPNRIQYLILMASMDEGESWRECARAMPGEKNWFTFQAPADGEYWLSVDYVDREGKRTQGSRAQPMKVVVKTPQH